MNKTKRIKTVLNFAIAAMVLLVLTAVTANAAEVTVSTTAPTVDATDVSNLVAQTNRHKWFHDVEHDAGQTFTPGEDVQINAFTIQIGEADKNDADASPESLTFRLGTITRPGGVFTFTDTYIEPAEWTMDWVGGDYITFTLDTPQDLTGGVEYGVILDAQAMGDWGVGIPYLAIGGNGYAGGNAIGRGDARSDDLVFHADLSASAVDDTLPEVEAGSDWITWSGASVTLDDDIVGGVVVTNNSDPVTALTYAWSADPVDGVYIEISPTGALLPTVTITKDDPTGDATVVTLVLAVNNVDSGKDDVIDIIQIYVYDDSCAAADAVGSAVSFGTGDINRDCITDLKDFAMMAAVWLVDYKLDAPVEK